MTKKSTLKRFVSLAATAAAMVIAGGSFSEVSAQRDPFQKPGFMRERPARKAPVAKAVKPTPPPVNYGPPPIEARIEYFKRLRETALANGTAMPKVTSVLTLNEMAVTGIFKTPRGYAAMVEATPIKLSYTIYPGEKFFDGQLVAVDENRLVFRKVSKVGDGKFVSSVENKPLKPMGLKGPEGTTASTPPTSDKPAETASNATPGGVKPAKPAHDPFLSPLDEMNRMPAETPSKEAPVKTAKKPARVAGNK